MSLINITISVATFAIAVLAVVTFIKNRKEESARVFFVMDLFIIAWSVSMLFFQSADSGQAVAYWAHILYTTASLIPILYVYFTLSFTKEKISKKQKIFLTLIFLPLLVIFIWPDVLIRGGEYIENGQNIINFGWGSWIYILYFSTFFPAGILILYKYYTRSSGIKKLQALYVLVGTTLAILVSVFTNLYPPHFGFFELNWVANVSVLIFVASIAYAIFKHQLFNIKVIATELFAALLIIVFLINALLADTPREYLVDGGLFILVIIISILLVRSTLREINALQEVSEKKSEFLSIASHQLRSPITVLKGYISMLREGDFGKLSKEQLRVVNNMYHSNENMQRLVEDFLNLSRAEKGTLKFNFKKQDLRAIIDTVVGEMKKPAEEKGLSFTWNKPEEPVEVEVDSEKIEQVVGNLVDNSIKYTEEGGVSLRIKRDEFKNTVQIYVQDTGIGLTKEDKENLFESFQRGRGEEKQASGTGLGMYVAKMLIEGHNGTIQAESEGKGEGTTIIIEIPEKQPHNEETTDN